MQDGSPAKPIMLQGVCHGHLVLVNVRQDAMFDALGLPRTARGLALKLEFLEIWEGSWVPGLPDGDKIPLLPEQGLIIRKAGVTRCLELDRCEASTKPRCLTSDRTRLPSLLRPSVELSSSSSAHRKERTSKRQREDVIELTDDECEAAPRRSVKRGRVWKGKGKADW